MGDVQEDDANLLLQRFELNLERSPEFRVQRAQRLVQQQPRRPEHQRPGQGHPLLLAAGQLAGAAPGERAELDEVERLVHLALDLLLAELAVAQAEGDVVEHAQEREKRITLKHGVDVAPMRRHPAHVDVVEQDLARSGQLEAGDQAQRRGLAAARRPEQGEKLAAGNLQVNLVDSYFREALGQRDQLNPATGHLGYLPFSRSLRVSSPLPRPGVHSNPSWPATKCMLSSKAAAGSTEGSSSAIWMVSPSSSADRQTANVAGSTWRNSPASWPARTSDSMTCRQRSSDFCRTLATAEFLAACAHRSSHSCHELCGSGSSSSRQLMATISSSRSAAVGSCAIRRWPTAYQLSS